MIFHPIREVGIVIYMSIISILYQYICVSTRDQNCTDHICTDYVKTTKIMDKWLSSDSETTDLDLVPTHLT